MQVSFEKRDNFTLVAHIVVPASDVAPIYKRYLASCVANGSVAGFRKGKAPAALIQARYAGKIEQDVIDELLRDTSAEFIKRPECKNVVASPVITKVGSIVQGQDFTFDLSLTVAPDVDYKPLSEIAVTKYVSEISDAEVNQLIESIRESFSPLTDLDDGVIGDTSVAKIDFLGKINGEPFEGGSDKGYSVYMSKPETMIPGFVEQLKGHKVGDKFEINCTFPADYVAELAGKDAVFEITVKGIAEPKLLDDAELCKNLGVDNFETLKKRAAENAAREAHRKVGALNSYNLGEALFAAYPGLELPKIMVDRKREEFVASRVDSILRQIHFTAHNKKMSDLTEHFAQMVIEQCKDKDAYFAKQANISFLMSHYFAEALAKLSPNEIEENYKKYIEALSVTFDDPEGFKNEVAKEKEAAEHYRELALDDLLFNKVLDATNSTAKNVDFFTLQKEYVLLRQKKDLLE